MDSLLAVYEAQPKAIDKEVKTFRALVLLHRAQVCQMQGKEAEAARYYEQYKSTDYGSSIEGQINGCDYLVEARRYAEAADNYTQLDRFIGAMNTISRPLAIICCPNCVATTMPVVGTQPYTWPCR